MNALTHATFRISSNKRSNQCTPGVHGRPPAILNGAHISKPMVSRCTSMSKLPFVTGLSPLRSVLNSARSIQGRAMSFRIPSNTYPLDVLPPLVMLLPPIRLLFALDGCCMASRWCATAF